MTTQDIAVAYWDDEEAGLRMPDGNIAAPFAWRRDDLEAEDWRAPISEDVLVELDAVAQTLSEYQGPMEELRPEAFALSAAADMMAEVGSRVYRGTGFALLDRLPVERWDERVSKAVVFLVTSLLGPVVMQKWNGTRLYDVRDTGAEIGYGVRRSITNLGQEFHTDGGWLERTPEIVGLACLQQAAAGGTSRVASLANVHNLIRERHGELITELYRPFWWDRQAEHSEGEAPCSRHPVYTWNGRGLAVRYYDDYIQQGHRLMNAPLGDKAAAALDTMQAMIEDPRNWIEFRLEPGQIEYVNNRLLAHARTAFTDSDGTDGGRHLLRIWVRRTGSIDLESRAATGD